MMDLKRTFSGAALATALAFTTMSFSGCAEPAQPESNANTAATNTAATTPAAATNTAPTAPGEIKPPLGMEDKVVGTVIGLACYKKTPTDLKAATACAKTNVGPNERLAVLGQDNVIYVGEGDARMVNEQLRHFIGQEVTVQGKNGTDAPELAWEGVNVKTFQYKLVRRNGPPPADAPKTMNPNVKVPNTNAPRQ